MVAFADLLKNKPFDERADPDIDLDAYGLLNLDRKLKRDIKENVALEK